MPAQTNSLIFRSFLKNADTDPYQNNSGHISDPPALLRYTSPENIPWEENKKNDNRCTGKTPV